MNRFLQTLLGAGVLLLGFILISHASQDGLVFGRYSIAYFLLLLCYAPLLVAGFLFWTRTGDIVAGFRVVMRSPLFWLVVGLLVLPAALIAVRFINTGVNDDLSRVLGLSFILLAFGLECVRMGSLARSRGLRWLQAGVLTPVATVYLAAALITPLFGTWVGQRLGMGSESTFDLVRPEESIQELWNQPGAEFVYAGQPGTVREFSVTVRNNSWGFHDRERRVENPENRERIVVLGDTYVQAWQVPLERGFPAVLETSLNREADRFEVIRLARVASGQAGELELLRTYGAKLAPNLVILVWATNDLLDNDPGLAALSVHLPDTLLFPGLLIDRLASKWLSKRSYLLSERLRLGVLRPDHWAYLNPMPDAVRVAYTKTEALLDEIVAECRSIGAEFMLVLKRPNNELRWLNRFPSLRSAYDFNPRVHHEWLSAYAASRGVHYLDTGPAFQAYYNVHPTGHPEQYSWPHDGHWREPGHELAAGLIYKYLVDNHLVFLNEPIAAN